ncbi:MlaD family protein [Janthinobacterium sp. RB2R34]|uniref:MlaD family protein n=1 Tax=Janthinobacterium sp. RB2R34 TaxID=3424193 RepID=UPI003F212724
MENRSHALLTGFFTLTLLVAAILFGIWFNRDRVERVPYLLATTLSVPGLNPQAAVRYRGLEVGKVDAIDFDTQKAGQILVHISVAPDTPVTNTTFATLGYQGVTGIAYIQLDDESVGSKLLGTSKERPSPIPLRAGLLDQLEKRGKRILDQAEQITNKVNNLLSDENQQAMLGAFTEVGKTAKAFGEIPKQLQPTLQQLPQLTDETRKSIASIKQAGENVTELSQTWKKLGTDLQAPGGMLDNVNGTVARVGRSVESVASGVSLEVLPQVIELSGEARSSMRALKTTMSTLNEQPQSILFGAPDIPPGPGEPGFSAPAK